MKKSFLEPFGSFNKLILIPGVLFFILLSVTQGCNGITSETADNPSAVQPEDKIKFCFCHQYDPEGDFGGAPHEGNNLCTGATAFDELRGTNHFQHYLCWICNVDCVDPSIPDPSQCAFCDDIGGLNADCSVPDLRGKCNGCGNDITECCVEEENGTLNCCTLEGDPAEVPNHCDNIGKPEGCVDELCDDGNNEDGDECPADCGLFCDSNEECDDGDPCNGSETCDQEGECQPGTPLICDDGNVCNGTEACVFEIGCQPGTPLNCDDLIACTNDSCEPCQEPVVDIAFIVIDQVCEPGCVNEPDELNCDDQDPCTADSCAPGEGAGADGCTHDPIPSGVPTTCGVGACAVTVDSCDECVPGQPSTEGPPEDPNCEDGIDNDCDGLTDLEDPECIPTVPEACIVDPNTPPQANDDGCKESIPGKDGKEGPCEVSADDLVAIDVLDNDTDPNGDPLTISSVGVPALVVENEDGTEEVIIADVGDAVPDASGEIQFTPDTDSFEGVDIPGNAFIKFNYTVSDGHTICPGNDGAQIALRPLGVAGCQLGHLGAAASGSASGLILMIGTALLAMLRRKVGNK